MQQCICTVSAQDNEQGLMKLSAVQKSLKNFNVYGSVFTALVLHFFQTIIGNYCQVITMWNNS